MFHRNIFLNLEDKYPVTHCKKAIMNTEQSYSALLNKQLNQLEDKKFDLSSWKKATALVVSSCFGSNSAQAAAIEKINYTYSSWTLRDESGTVDSVKTACKTTLTTIITEYKIKTATVSEKKQSKKSDLSFMWLPFEDELTGASLKTLKALLLQPNASPVELKAFLKDLPSQTMVNILQNILLADDFKKWLKHQ